MKKRKRRKRRVWDGSGLGSVAQGGSAGAAAESSSGGPERQTGQRHSRDGHGSKSFSLVKLLKPSPQNL